MGIIGWHVGHKNLRKKRSKSVCALVAKEDDRLDAMKYAMQNDPLGGAGAGLASLQKDLDIMMNAKIDHAALSNAAMNVFFPSYMERFRPQEWSKVALRNLISRIS